ncbi:hypothetical protein J2855_000379 [Agrobacterium tumefaciens]|jgi:hypothetical protein|nr:MULTISPECIES: hypothetical protein [Agrobacterium]MBP2506773.1 hypothetical protein [Agrobacterium tumefaciens]MBP2516825.1 hypothetical protein [Agrobacterium tumefaciens]MBP2575459.1 hypothetical protein [Agrobacterium tumefaciens]MBP2592915.1 hypothetical protein [Agrobacterium tumefaciens]MDP9786032.1 hypothetical protein [Agrobacterium tumefaciens]
MREIIGNEFRLMREGKKPLSMFYYIESEGDKDLIPVDDFKPFVEDGSILMEEFILPNHQHPRFSVTYILYSLREEAWRIPALKTALIAQQDNIQRPDEGIDRIIGLLLGYSKEEIDQWVKKGIEFTRMRT